MWTHSFFPSGYFAGSYWTGSDVSPPSAPPDPLTAAAVLWVEPARPLTCRWGFYDVLTFRQDLAGVTETRTVTFDFTQAPEIRAGDRLSAAVIDQDGPSGATAWTISTPTVGSIKVTARFSGATPPGKYTISCRATTVAGYVLEILGTILLLPRATPAPIVLFHEDVLLVPENRLAAFDFSKFPEIAGGDILTGTPVVTQAGPGFDALTIAVRGIATNNRQVIVNLTGGGPAYATYTLTCRCPTLAGSVLVAAGTFVLASSN